MIYWSISLLWGIIGLFIFWGILSAKWAKLDPLFVRMLDKFRLLNPIPGHPGYMDLKFSLLRHSFVFLVSAVLIFFVKVKFVLTITLTLNVFYAYSTVSRYKYRKRYLQETAREPDSEALVSYLAVPVKDSFCVVVYSVVCAIILYVLYAIRP